MGNSVKHVGIMGKAGSGKDFTAEVLAKYAEKVGATFVKVALADPIKQILITVWPSLPPENLWGDSDKREIPIHVGGGVTIVPRVILQELGTDIARKHDPDVWVKKLLTTIRYLSEGYRYNREVGILRASGLTDTSRPLIVVTPDVRFPNECHSIRKTGGFVLGLQDASSSSGSKEWSSHKSETSMDFSLADLVIQNKKDGEENLVKHLEPVFSFLDSLSSLSPPPCSGGQSSRALSGSFNESFSSFRPNNSVGVQFR